MLSPSPHTLPTLIEIIAKATRVIIVLASSLFDRDLSIKTPFVAFRGKTT